MMCHWQTLSVFFLKKTLDNNVVKRFGKGCSISANILEIWKYVYCRKGFQSNQCTLKKEDLVMMAKPHLGGYNRLLITQCRCPYMDNGEIVLCCWCEISKQISKRFR